MLKILCDQQLVNAQEAFSPIGAVVTKNGREIRASDLEDVDALIVRSVTRVDRELLQDARRLVFVGTATSGIDHIDTQYLAERKIHFATSKGCNCESVADYVLSVMLLSPFDELSAFEKRSIGIIGCGNVGGQVELRARGLGMTIKKCDPLRYGAGDETCNAEFEEALACDFVTLHVPLTMEDPYKTYHMIDGNALNKLKAQCCLINASRGPVVDNNALLDFLRRRRDVKAYLDVFEWEPDIPNVELLRNLKGASPHIAGYALEAKKRSCITLAQRLDEYLGLHAIDPNYDRADVMETISLAPDYVFSLPVIRNLCRCVYDVREDFDMFRLSFTGPESFDDMRKNYRVRHELQSMRVANVRPEDVERFRLLGFDVKG